MPELYKFGWLPDGETEQLYEYPDVWVREHNERMDRLAIAPRSSYVALLEKLARAFEPPYILLYVLVVPRTGNKSGRFESEYSFSLPQLQTFLSVYREYLETDGRHNLWIRPASGEGLLIYDRHNIIYAYGSQDRILEIVKAAGLQESPGPFLCHTSPHVHHYHPSLDAYEERILKDEEWTTSPLRPGDENPE